jgi:hypothetical protein
VLANVSALLAAMALSATVVFADTTKSGSSMPMEEKMGMEKNESMTGKGHMKMEKDQRK